MRNNLTNEEIQRRIMLDFPKTFEQIFEEIREIMPEITKKQIENWEKSKVLEYIELNGEKRYFRRAVRNAFRIDKNAKEYYNKKFGDEKAGREKFLSEYLPTILNKNDRKAFNFKFKLTVKPDAVPDGEIIRCWLPFPQTTESQKVLMPDNFSGLTENDKCHSSVYFEKRAEKGKPTVFTTEFEFSTESFCYTQKSMNIRQKSEQATQSPKIVKIENQFKLKEFSRQIVGNETDKYLIAKKIFTWISENIVWTVAREYSTIENIPEYVLENRHGDCGQTTLLFMALCRINSIQTRWLSGFMLHPNYENLHDWCEIFIENLGWLPVDVSFGLQKWTDNEALKYFYFGGMDAYRLVVNCGISDEFFPKKIFTRSDIIDFQRGETEWQGGNIYFDCFDYEFKAISL